ncbi:MAG: hypothetical protein F4137_10760 [Acidobacteria bacterium]|nr:hypothetical protein [Acidobacteriota bacterium]
MDWWVAVTPYAIVLSLGVVGGSVAALRGIPDSAPTGVAIGVILIALVVGVGAALVLNVVSMGVFLLFHVFSAAVEKDTPSNACFLSCLLLSFWSQTPLAGVTFAVRLLTDDPTGFASSPAGSWLELVGVMSGIWLLALQCSILHVVSRYSFGFALSVGVILGLAFHVTPWVAGRI